MGVDVYVMDFLLRLRPRTLGSTLWLGRQGFHMPRDAASSGRISDHQKLAMDVLRQHAPETPYLDVAGDTGYAEALFRFLGSTSITAIDNSSYEGAEIIHDMNEPVPYALARRFDCIFDGGTIEHIFNVPTAFENVNRMLEVGGLFISVNGANNFLGHGLYQFSPELFWRVFSKESGYEVEAMCLVGTAGFPNPKFLTDPEKLGHREEIGYTPTRTYLMVAARKTHWATESRSIQQSDYAAMWRNTAPASARP